MNLCYVIAWWDAAGLAGYLFSGFMQHNLKAMTR
jgi:hypothetical protein